MTRTDARKTERAKLRQTSTLSTATQNTPTARTERAGLIKCVIFAELNSKITMGWK